MSRLRVALGLTALLLARLATAQPAAPRIASVTVDGSIDPPGRVDAVIGDIAPRGSYYVEAGPADREGTPISTTGRLSAVLNRIGYDARYETRPEGPGEVALIVHLRAYDRVRQIFVEGNWPLRQDQIGRLVALRPGQALPPVGPLRDQRLDLERGRILDHLRDRGFREATVRIDLRSSNTIPARVNMFIRLHLGPAYPIGPIEVSGGAAIPPGEVADRLRHRDYRFLWLRPLPFDRLLLTEDLNALTQRYHDLGYPGARLSHSVQVDPQNRNVRLRIDVNQRKRLELAFDGNDRFADDTLREQVTFFSRGAYDDFEAQQSAAAIEGYYREHGHMLAHVRWRRDHVDEQTDRVTFTVDEGAVLKVREVSFVGNRQVRASTLGDVVNVKVFPPLGSLGLGDGGYASQRQLALDVDNLVVWYRNAGFPDAKVRCEIAPAPGEWRPLATANPEKDPRWQKARGLHVRFLVDEGVRVRIGEIAFLRTDPGDPLPYGEKFLRDSLLLTVGAPLQPLLVRQDADRLRRVFGDAGYRLASAEPSVTRDGATARVVWQVKLGPRIYLGPAFVRGNFHTTEATVLQWIPLQPGSVLTTTALERGQRNLALIQLFNNASPVSFPGEGPADPLVPMLVEVEERYDYIGSIRPGLGISTDQAPPDSSFPIGIYGAIGYENRNLLGHGWTGTTQFNYGNSLTRALANFVDPRFFGSLFRLELAGSYLRQATVRLGDIHSGGGSIGFAREMYPGVDAALRYNLRNTFRTEFLLRGAGPLEDQATTQIGTFVSSFTFTVDWQRLDHPLVPTRGFKVSAGAEYADPAFSFGVGQDRFLKVITRSLSVVPLLPWLSLRHSVRWEQGFPFGAPVLPKVERFFAGGDTTIRGYEVDRARTQIVRSPYADAVSVQYRPVGGNLRILHNVDLQFPILRPWYGAVFIDSGVVADSLDGLSFAQFRHGAGISPLLIKLPIGDISLSWGWPLDPQPGDARLGRLHFNVGLMF